MNHAIHPKLFRICVMILMLIFIVSLLSLQTVHAADIEDGWKQNIELTGNFVGTFSLNSNTAQILRVENAAPGDRWEGEITIKNSAGGPMEVALLTITSLLEDTALFETLELELEVGNDIVYSGSYDTSLDPITPFYVIPADQSMVIHVCLSFPPEVGNEMQGKEMDSLWTFEARYLGDGPGPALYPYAVMYIDDSTGERLADDKVSYAPYGEEVTEQALDIVGYVPDASEKTIVIQSEDNVIVFLYEGIPVVEEEPAASVSEGPSEGNGTGTSGKGVPTGHDLADSNTTNLIYALLIGVCLLSICVIILRIRAARRDSE